MKKRGFTLIELMAVIIILAAVALIVSPLVMDLIKEQKQKTFKESVNGIFRAIKIDAADDGYATPRIYEYNNGTLLLTTVEGEVLASPVLIKTEGKIETDHSYTITYNDEGDIELPNICDKDWCANNRTGEIVITER